MKFFGWGLARKFRQANLQRKRTFLLKMMPKNSICAEIGVHLGDYSERILKITKPKELHLIDPWKYEQDETYNYSRYGGTWGENQITMNKRYELVLNRFKSKIDSGSVVIHMENSGILEKFNNDFFDWVYIDGNHLYEFVKKDLELSYYKVKKGGFITGDDYSYEGWWKGGVTKAVDEFIKQGQVKLIKFFQYSRIFHMNYHTT